MKPTVGLIGLGLMGKPMGRNLLKAGFPLVVWNRTAARAEDLVSEGAKLGANPRETAAAADVLISIVSDPPALEDVLWGAQGAMEGLRRGSIYMDSSTISPDLAQRVAAACGERGVEFSGCAGDGRRLGREKRRVGIHDWREGGSAGARESGAGSAGEEIFLAGANGAGQTVKLAMNLILALEVEALAEALALATSAGVPGEKLVEVMQSSMARAGVLDVKAPLMLKNEYRGEFSAAADAQGHATRAGVGATAGSYAAGRCCCVWNLQRGERCVQG